MKIRAGAVTGAAVAAARRFPLALVCGLAAAWTASLVVDSSPGQEQNLVRILSAGGLGIPLFIGLTLFAEGRGFGARGLWLARLVGAAVLFLFFWSFDNWTETGVGMRVFHLGAALHFAVAVSPFLGRERSPGGRPEQQFWEFNKRLFLRFLLGAVYTGVLYAGLSAALAGLDNLFGVDVSDLTYARLFFFMAFLFQTWFVVAGIPRTDVDEPRGEYPVGLRVFAQYVLLPLVAVYFLILTAYMVRVLALGEWPSGWIGFMVSWLALVGILALLLVYPQRGGEGPVGIWLDRYSRWFWVAVLPQTGMLAAAIWQRIGQYGVSEARYLLAAATVWLAGASAFAIVRKPSGIRWIPLSLACVAGLTLVGPWSAYSVAQRSQAGRLDGILALYPAATVEISVEDLTQVRDIFGYLVEMHGEQALTPWFQEGAAGLAGGGEPLSGWGRDADRLSRLAVTRLGYTAAAGVALEGLGTVTSSDWGNALLVAPGATFIIEDMDLLDGRYAGAPEPATEIRSTISETESLLVIEWGDVRLAGSYPHVLEAAAAESARTGEHSFSLPRDRMAVDLASTGAGGRAATVYISRLRFVDGSLEEATGLAIFVSDSADAGG